MYGKLKDGILEIAPKVVVIDGKTICNPTDAELEKLGYKKIRYTEKPTDAPEGKEYACRWTEQEKEIVQEWFLTDKIPTMEDRIKNMEEAMQPVYVVAQNYAQDLTDEEAITVKHLYEKWEKLCKESYFAEKKGFKFRHIDTLYKTIQENYIFKSQWVPGEGTESIFEVINEKHKGTKEDPIPYNGNMTLEKDKYYIQDDVTYYCWNGSGVPVYDRLENLETFVRVIEEE